MEILYLTGFFLGYFPLARMWWANRQTSLLQAGNWAIAAWSLWIMCRGFGRSNEAFGLDAPQYLALCLTGCACVAVLGARRPHVGAWNFVLLGLLAILILPLVERLVTGVHSLDIMRMIFLGGIIAVGLLNYLPTCFGPASVCFFLGCGGEWLILLDDSWAKYLGFFTPFFQMVVPWLGWWGWAKLPVSASELNRLWFDFRNRYGLVWGLRVREQFNRSAAHAAWPVHLYWQGLVRAAEASSLDQEIDKEMLQCLKSLLKRFMVDVDTTKTNNFPKKDNELR